MVSGRSRSGWGREGRGNGEERVERSERTAGVRGEGLGARWVWAARGEGQGGAMRYGQAGRELTRLDAVAPGGPVGFNSPAGER